jgi:signal transduction histidine kinase
LGLAIVQAVVADHSGRIWVESAPGRGATFHIELAARSAA